jgi:putative hydrolase of HD superfamily
MTNKDICNYIFELGALKKFRHSGFKFAGVINPDSIAEHAYRSAMIAYLLAKMEKHKDPEKLAFRCLIHDNAEARISDLHKIAQRYIDPRKAELKAYKDQVKKLPKDTQKDFLTYFEQYEKNNSKDGKIMRDADLLETSFQAKEYLDLGYNACENWITNAESLLSTASAKTLMKTLKKTKFTEWFKNIKKISQD